ncbi:MAG TPA: excinuclease ABC subunit C, partial [Clostridiales bacterium]|nr:excinuclease ABC subunit C [Clostridiales bacterium]
MLPDAAGVYILRDAAGRPLYIGKARSLRNRVRSHFQAGRSLEARAISLYSRVASVDYITTPSEVDALILESNLIKEHRPDYNIKLRDDKHFPYLKIDLSQDFPRVEVVRRMKKDGARYFGPYTRAGSLRETLRTLRRVFPYRTCTDHRMRTASRPCLDYQIRRCAGPCVGRVSPEDYRAMMEEMCLFLEGRQADLVSRLRERMERAAAELEFEKAAE